MRTQLHQWHSLTDRKVILTLELPLPGGKSSPVVRTPAYEINPNELTALAQAAHEALHLCNIALVAPEPEKEVA